MKKFYMKRNAKNKWNEVILSLLSAWGIYLCFLSPALDTNNIIYAIGQIHEYDQSLFASNIYISDTRISPRLIVDTIFSLFMRLTGGNWVPVAAFFVYISGFLLAVATVTLAFKLSKNNRLLYTSIIALFFAQNVSGQVAAFDTFNETTIGMGMGYSFAILAISFVVGERKNFNAAWIALAVSTMCHVHEGLYGFVTVFILLLTEIIYWKKFSIRDNVGIFLYLGVLGGVIIPNMLTDPINISNEEFIYIYICHLSASTSFSSKYMG